MKKKLKKKMVQMCASSNCSKMDNKIEISQTYFDSSQNRNGNQNDQMINPNESDRDLLMNVPHVLKKLVVFIS